LFAPGDRRFRLGLVHGLGWHLGRGLVTFCRGVRDSFRWGYGSARGQPRVSASRERIATNRLSLLTLMGLLVGILAALLLPTKLPIWPVLFASAAVLIAIVRGPLSGAPSFLLKVLRLGISLCVALGFLGLLTWTPFWEPFALLGFNRKVHGGWFFLAVSIGWWIAFFWIVFSKPKRARIGVRPGSPAEVSQQFTSQLRQIEPGSKQQVLPKVPGLRFADVGGLEDEKQQIRDLVESRVQPGKYAKYGVVRNGILLYGPPGSGKTFLAEAIAGEFALAFRRVLASDLVSMWMGETEKRIHTEFEDAVAHVPVLLFFDEVDSLVTTRQPLGTGGDPGGAGRSFNSATTTFMEMMTKYRDVPGLVLMLATNKMEGLDEAVVREGRIDLEIRVDLPNEAMRLKILEKQLENRPWRRFDLKEFAQKTVGTSPAKIRALVDKAATFAAAEGRRIEESDLRRAFEQSGGKDRPPFEPVEWSDLVLEEDVESDVRMLVRLLNEPGLAKKIQVPISTGVLLVGPTGTGKTTIARLIATQSNRSFYQITPADILGRYTGDSVKQIAGLFSRAKGHSPSLIFIDELDALLPQANTSLGQHDVQVVDQFLIEISSLQAENNVFLMGATNRPEGIDPRVLRGGRFSEKIKVGLPGRNGREKLLIKYLGPVRLEAGLEFGFISGLMDGFAPADLKAICDAAKRLAFMRAKKDQPPPPLSRADIEGAIERVRGFA
jgi:transitional endoplasmic reticulum ATPase